MFIHPVANDYHFLIHPAYLTIEVENDLKKYIIKPMHNGMLKLDMRLYLFLVHAVPLVNVHLIMF